MNWLARLLAWDGVLPLVVWAIPAILNAALPQNDKLAVLVAVLLACRSSTTASPLRRRLTPLSVCARATWPR